MRVSGFLAGLVIVWGPSEGGLAWPSLGAGEPDASDSGCFAGDELGLEGSETLGGVGVGCLAIEVGFFWVADEVEIVEPGFDSGDSLAFVGNVEWCFNGDGDGGDNGSYC